MSRGINTVTLIGHLGADPEIRTLPSGDPVAKLSLATGETWKDKTSGESRERTEWHRVVLLGRFAEIAGQSLHSGAQVYVEGTLRTRRYQAQDGGERFVTEVVVEHNGTLLMLNGHPKATVEPARTTSASGAPPTKPPSTPSGAATTPARGRPQPTAPAVPVPEFDDSIPF
ncbi:single-stranded DNA-binding protein [Thiocystis violascens]|uniref:Single-stranded DNA-binding protein n=1 Tax=Thiocystis violascens (strain ATCC 17096 / DSM 198 / 6111) TaxID=765911 RepID=I3Y923_THIV6|nr:single-stranded DNA-binding protein [Thiocystis violascens]AFL73491.1 single stranded DNA-binding protein [Thiocystis violascens DSM 198]